VSDQNKINGFLSAMPTSHYDSEPKSFVFEKKYRKINQKYRKQKRLEAKIKLLGRG